MSDSNDSNDAADLSETDFFSVREERDATVEVQRTIDETERRRELQIAYNEKHGIIPTALNKSKEIILESTKVADGDLMDTSSPKSTEKKTVKIEKSAFKNEAALDQEIRRIKKAMEKAAKELEFIEAAGFRDEMKALQKLKKSY